MNFYIYKITWNQWFHCDRLVWCQKNNWEQGWVKQITPIIVEFYHNKILRDSGTLTLNSHLIRSKPIFISKSCAFSR